MLRGENAKRRRPTSEKSVKCESEHSDSLLTPFTLVGGFALRPLRASLSGSFAPGHQAPSPYGFLAAESVVLAASFDWIACAFSRCA